MTIYDHLGVGFGPANLALCISLYENADTRASRFTMCFIERQPAFAWHPSLLLPGAQLQVSPLKDLATMRDPTSSFTFLNFLHEHGRLMPYINREEKVPSRREWSAYLAWAAKRMDSFVRYGRQVVDIVPIEENGSFSYFQVECLENSTQKRESFFARNVSLGVGGWANIPDVFQPMYKHPLPASEAVCRVVHASSFLPQMMHLGPVLNATQLSSRPLRLAVIGGGQSSAEMLCYLRDHYPQAALDMIFRAPALVPSDDSPFVNAAAFDPSSVTTFWESTASQRRRQLAEFKRTNYSVVRNDLLSELYEIVYDQDVNYREPLEEDKGLVRILASTELVRAEQLPDGRLQIDTRTNVGERLERTHTYDAVFLGTGFQRDPSQLPFVRTLANHFPLLSQQGSAQLREQELALDDQASLSQDPDSLRAQLRGITRDYRLVPSDASQWKLPLTPPSSTIQHIPRSQLGREGRREPTLSRYNARWPPASSTHPASESASTSTSSAPLKPMAGAVFLFGCNEPTHGLSDSLMSMVAHRAGIVTASLLYGMQTHS